MNRIDRKRLALLVALPMVGILAYFIAVRVVAGYHQRAAMDALARRDFRTASSHLAKYLDLRSGDFDARLLAAQTARRQGSLNEAQQHLDIFVKQSGRAADRERLLLRIQWGDLSDSSQMLEDCAEQPDSPETPMNLEALIEGTLRVQTNASNLGLTAAEGELARAREGVDLWLRLRKGPADQAQGLLWRARIHELTQEQGKAIADLRRALELDPDHADARLQLAIALFQTAPAEALRHLEWLHQRYPEDKTIRNALAVVCRHIGDKARLDQAASLLDGLIESDPKEVSYLVERGRVATNADRLDDAERFLRRAYALAPEEPDVNLALSGCLFRAGRTEEAQGFFDAGKKIADERKRKQEEQPLKRSFGGKK